MIGLIIIFLVGGLFLSIILLTLLSRFLFKFAAQKLGCSPKNIRRWSWVGVGLVLVPLIGEGISVHFYHDYLCRNKSGFFQYVSPEAWLEKNPEMRGQLVRYTDKEEEEGYKAETQQTRSMSKEARRRWVKARGGAGGFYYNARFMTGILITKKGLGVFEVSRRLLDRKTHEVIAESREY